MDGKLREQEIFEQYHLQKSDFSSDDEYFLAVAAEIGKTSTCNRGNCGCLLVQKGEIVAFGAADAPQGSPTCQEV
jgi:deoxycytidylate deaminase